MDSIHRSTKPGLQPRRQFIQRTSLAVGASLFAAPQLLRARSNDNLQGTVRSAPVAAALALSGAVVNLYEASDDVPRLLGTATTNQWGNFSFRSRPARAHSKGIYYVTADLAPGLQLVSVPGPELPAFVTLNELTTVAAGYSLAQFIQNGLISGNEFGLRIAAGMNENLVNPGTGESSPVLLSSPNADQTNSLRSTRALANLLALFVRDGGANLDVLFSLTTPPGGSPPNNLLQALSNIARYPHQHVAALYALAQTLVVYAPTLERPPHAWTLVVKVNDTGSDDHDQLFGGPGNLSFDADGYAWITNNVVQDTPNSCQFNVVLKPNGQPADGRNGTPKSPLFGGGILGAGFGINIAPNGKVWMGNFGWGGDSYNPSPDGNGSVSEFSKNGQPLSGPEGIQAGVDRAQGIATDAEGNIWICSFGNDRVVVFPKGNPTRAIYFQESSGSGPFDIQIGNDGTAWVSNSGGLIGPDDNSRVARFALEGGEIKSIFDKPLGHSLKGVALDSQGQAWIASGADDCVYLVDRQGDKLRSCQGGGIDSPWSTAVDGDDNIWVANFGPEQPGDFRNPNLTKLAGSNPETRPPGLNAGDPISPDSGYTLPSAGEEVLLHDGTPLYGAGEPPCFQPLMRVTAVVIDQAGNVWALNNWKPPFANDLKNNPGGDGICIFVGLAKPPANRWAK
jgi:hypothetical protein